MTRARTLILAIVLASLGLPLWAVARPHPAAADLRLAEATPPLGRRALMFLVDRVSFDQLLSVPAFRQLTRAGGAAIMTTHVGGGDRERSSYLTIANGSTSSSADVPSLLGRVLAENGVTACSLGSAGSIGAPDSPGELVVGRTGGASAGCPVAPAAQSDPLFPGGIRTDPVAIVSAAAAMPPGSLAVIDLGDTLRVDREASSSEPDATAAFRDRSLAEAGLLVRQIVGSFHEPDVLVVVVTAQPSLTMDQVGDEVTPLVVAEGDPASLFPADGALRSLTSDTTRQVGLLSNVDVSPTVLAHFGIPIPSEMDGEPARATDEPAPYSLYQRQLEQRRTRVPVQVGEAVFVSLAFAAAVVALWLVGAGANLPSRAASAVRFVALMVAGLCLVLLAGGGLPHLTYAYVVPYLVVSLPVLAVLSLVGRRRGPVGPFVFIGVLGLAFVVVDGALGGGSFRTPLLGGTMFDGVRFYGLPNAFAALALASALMAAFALEPLAGAVILAATGLFVGFPGLGADVGGAITLFVAAGLWWVLRARERVDARGLAGAALLVVAGLALVLLANRVLPGAATHATRFVERTGGRVGEIGKEAWRRLGIGARQVERTPVALIPLVGLPVGLWVSVRGPRPFDRGLSAVPGWRDVLSILAVASMVAFAVNDTGVAAAAPAFTYLMAWLTFPVLLGAAARGVRRRSEEASRE